MALGCSRSEFTFSLNREETVKKFSIKALGLILGSILLANLAWGQATTSLRGTVYDHTGAVIPKALATLTNTATGFERKTTTGQEGVYELSQLLPGTYRLTVVAEGFKKYEATGLQLLVNDPATVNVTLEVGGKTETIAVTAEAPLLNTTDASVGSVITESQVKQLPLDARDVAALYSMQPGVVYLGNRTDINLNSDTRSGAVNGAHSDQSNITLDGVDVNDQSNGYAFTSVLRVSPDAMQEFRVSTTNYDADQGRSSGAQVSIATKSGTNTFHGSLYEYNRNTATSANDWFIKQAEYANGEKNQALKLIRNIFGGTIGGPIKKDRAFFFLNYEGRRDSQADSEVRTVPTLTLRQGIVRYQDVNGGVTALTPAQLAQMDPLGIGPNPVMMNFFQTYPTPNDPGVGDGLNYSGFRFAAPVRNRFNTYFARLDYQLTADGRHSLFFRGSAQKDNQEGAPYLPGLAPLEVDTDFSKGFVIGYTASLSPTMVNNFRYGLTRQSQARNGNSDQPFIRFRGLNDNSFQAPNNFFYGRGFTLPVNNFVDDFSWKKGSHSLSMGANVRFIRNARTSLANSFSDAVTNASWLDVAGVANTGSPLDPGANGFPAVADSFDNSYDYPLIALMGVLTEVDSVYNSDKTGALLPQGTPIKRHFGADEYELYLQDSYRVKSNLTVTYGLRWELLSPPWETNGVQVSPNVDMGQWFRTRGNNMRAGIPSNQDPLVSFALGGPANGKPGFYNWDYRNFAPRIGIAYSPNPSSAFFQRLLGNNKTSIRAGFGIVYDRIGAGLLSSFDQNGSFGLSSTITNPAGVQSIDSAPRVTSLNDLPTFGACPAPLGNFPRTPPAGLDCGFAITWGLDNSIKTPYAYQLAFSVSRELPKNLFFEASYVGHLAHRLLAQDDLAMPLDLTDPTSGVDYFSAASRFSQLGNAGVSYTDITPEMVGPTAAYWPNVFPGLATNLGIPGTDLQAAYAVMGDPSGFLHNETTGLFALDLPGIYCANGCSKFGPFAFWNSQYSSLYAWRSLANSSYHALQLTLRKRFSQGVQFDINYTFSKSIDLSSDAERISPWGGLGGEIINSWDHKQLRAVSDFDARHQINSDWIAEFPFGKGKRFGKDAHGVAEALLGGWQLSGIYRWTSGYPVNVFSGATWPTNWQLGGAAVPIAPLPTTGVNKHNADGSVNLFADPSTAIQGFRVALPGESGSRNFLRGPGFFGMDMGLSKRWTMPYSEHHSIQFRWDVFNVPNATRFDVQQVNLSLDNATDFGKYTGLLTSPRTMQFALRYEF
jgi:hypothetical protein